MLALIPSHLFIFDQLGYKGECLSNFWFPEVYEATRCACSFSLVVSVPLATLYRECSTSICWSVVDWPELFSHLKVSMQHTNMSKCFEDVAWAICHAYVFKVTYRFLLTRFNVPMLLLCTFSCITTKKWKWEIMSRPPCTFVPFGNEISVSNLMKSRLGLYIFVNWDLR